MDDNDANTARKRYHQSEKRSTMVMNARRAAAKQHGNQIVGDNNAGKRDNTVLVMF